MFKKSILRFISMLVFAGAACAGPVPPPPPGAPTTPIAAPTASPTPAAACATGWWRYNNLDGISFSVAPGESGSPANTFPPPCETAPACYWSVYSALVTNPNPTAVSFNAFVGVSNPYDFAAPMWPFIGVDYSDTNWRYTVPADGTLPFQLFRMECPIAATYSVDGETCTIPAPTAPLIPDNTNTAGQCNIAQCGNSGTCGTGIPYESPEVVNLDTTTTDSALSITMNAFQVVGMPMFTSEIQK